MSIHSHRWMVRLAATVTATLAAVTVAVPVSAAAEPPSPRIIGGVDSPYYPFFVTPLANGGPFCGGALIRRTWVLTAAHCLDPIDGARIGSINNDRGGETRRVIRKIGHPSIDIALMQLDTPSTYPPARVATGNGGPGAAIRLLGFGTTCTPGWCPTDRLKMLDTRINRIEGGYLRVGNPAAGQSACSGDSGAPAVQLIGGEWQVTAVTSGGPLPRCTDDYSSYSDATQLRAWIDGIAGGFDGGSSGQMIIGAGSNRCVDVAGGNPASGTRVQLWDCHGGPEVRWRWNGASLVNARTGKCLDVAGGSTAAGARVQIWDCLGNGAQQWQLVNGNLRNPASSMCLDADAWGTGNGTPLIIWHCGSGQSNQTWRFAA